MTIHLDRARLDEAVRRGLVAPDKAEPLWAYLSEQAAEVPAFRVTHILYYAGGLIAIGAMTLFITLGWEMFGGWGLLAIAAAYAAAGIWLTEYFLTHMRLRIPAGIAGAFVVALAPLAIYGLQVGLGFWPEGQAYRDYHARVDWRWVLMELGTLAAGAAMLWRYRLPFLTMPLAVTLWYMSMDVTPFLFGVAPGNWDIQRLVSLWFGLAMVLLAFWVDLRSRRGQDYAFWLYLFGVPVFWGGLSLLPSNTEWSRLAYLGANLAMIVVGAALSRRVFVVFGGIGAAGYVSYLAYRVFRDSLVFPFALTLVGLGVIGLGIVWQRHEVRIASWLHGRMPVPLRELVERRS